MKYQIPKIGDVIRLMLPWTFRLACETRNETVYKLLPVRYEVPEWIKAADWKNLWRRTERWSAGDAVIRGIPVPDMPEGHYITGCAGHDRKQPAWLGRFRHKVCKRHDRADKNGKITGADYYLSYENEDNDLTIEPGAELVVDRVYIRQGAAGFSSVSFRYPEKKARFFVSLDDACAMDFEFVRHKVMYESNHLRASIGG